MHSDSYLDNLRYRVEIVKTWRQRIANLGYTNKEFCRLISESETQLSYWLIGRRVPRNVSLQRIELKLQELEQRKRSKKKSELDDSPELNSIDPVLYRNLEEGKRKIPKEKDISRNSSSVKFQEFWDEYAYKKARSRAECAYKKAITITSHEEIILGVKKYKLNRGQNQKYWKHPATWLNDECWSDEYSINKPEVNKDYGETGDWTWKK